VGPAGVSGYIVMGRTEGQRDKGWKRLKCRILWRLLGYPVLPLLSVFCSIFVDCGRLVRGENVGAAVSSSYLVFCCC
jgi:hypothetical protein